MPRRSEPTARRAAFMAGIITQASASLTREVARNTYEPVPITGISNRATNTASAVLQTANFVLRAASSVLRPRILCCKPRILRPSSRILWCKPRALCCARESCDANRGRDDSTRDFRGARDGLNVPARGRRHRAPQRSEARHEAPDGDLGPGQMHGPGIGSGIGSPRFQKERASRNRRPPRSGSGVWPPAPERVDFEVRCDSSRRSCPVSSPGEAARSAGGSSACSRRFTGPAPGGAASPPPGRDRRKRAPRIFCLGSSPPYATWARRLCSTRPAATSTGHPVDVVAELIAHHEPKNRRTKRRSAIPSAAMSHFETLSRLTIGD